MSSSTLTPTSTLTGTQCELITSGGADPEAELDPDAVAALGSLSAEHAEEISAVNASNGLSGAATSRVMARRIKALRRSGSIHPLTKTRAPAPIKSCREDVSSPKNMREDTSRNVTLMLH